MKLGFLSIGLGFRVLRVETKNAELLSGFHEKLAKKQVAFRQWRFQHMWSHLFDPKERQEQQSRQVK
jgi:hypothetical protein